MAHQPSEKDWRELAKQVSEEMDPGKLVERTEELLKKYDESLRPENKKSPETQK